MELYEKVKALIDKEHGNDLDENKVMLVLLYDTNTEDGLVFANGSETDVALTMIEFLRSNPRVMKTMTNLIMSNYGEVLQQES